MGNNISLEHKKVVVRRFAEQIVYPEPMGKSSKGAFILKNRHLLWINIPIFVMLFMLSACTEGIGPSAATETASEAESVSPPSSVQEPSVEATRPVTESFELMTAEGNQSLEAVLHQGKGFSLYIFEKFAFDATAGRLSLSSNPDYYVDIERLSSEYDLAQLEAAGKPVNDNIYDWDLLSNTVHSPVRLIFLNLLIIYT